MRDYLVGKAVAAGHDPREIREYARRDLELMLLADSGGL